MTDKQHVHPASESDCLSAMDHLYAYLNGELDDQPEALAIVEFHLGHCRSCFSRAEMERVMNDRLRHSGKEKTPEALKARLRRLLDSF